MAALTASVNHRRDPDIKAAGFDGYICKPLDIHELVALLKKHLPSLTDADELPPASNAQPPSLDARRAAREAMTEFGIGPDRGVRFDDLGNFIVRLRADPVAASDPEFTATVDRLDAASRTFDIRAIEQILSWFGDEQAIHGDAP